ncbi:winged helix-turn-helix transcriptional regulator [Stagnihabitans tardus]|uniref:HTH hxlR-type domain-containing protein n=1 Tax=Stagnihabitans tardus TaxID=2699202 RepID=A0AAE5BWZ8_9RHOB|nr:helix-turn-helix domain-containing protein [Stagnihabitans tardus]NBZ88758.1 hypothetical protein [Stagnihabitans tardus]
MSQISASQDLGRRRYDMACPIASALDQVGERWTLLILRELLPGPLRFSTLKSTILGINATILSRRLDQMATEGLVRLADGGDQTGYAATARAATLWPILVALAGWGLTKSLGGAPGLEGATVETGLTPAAAVTAFVALRPPSAPRRPIGFTLQGPRLEWSPEQPMPLVRCPGRSALEVTASPETLLSLVAGRLSLAEARARDLIALEGEAGLLTDHLPEPVGRRPEAR